MTTTSGYPSIHDTSPVEQGGPVARKGFLYQDHVAAAKCLEMARSQEIAAVWCETFDDLTIILGEAPDQRVEFVQVKSNDLNQLWTAAKLCEKEALGANNSKTAISNGHSSQPALCILERSLSHDRYSEPCTFRIVTSRQVSKSLKFLTWPIGSPGRTVDSEGFVELARAIAKKPVASFTSARGRDYTYWLEHTTWEVPGDLESVKKSNLLALLELSEDLGFHPGPDQRLETYEQILSLVKAAGDSPWFPDPSKKKVDRIVFRERVGTILSSGRSQEQIGNDNLLRTKLNDALVPTDMIFTASDLRLSYLRRLRRPQFLDVNTNQDIYSEISGRLLALRSDLYSGKISDSGTQFHYACLDAVKEIHEKWNPMNRPSLDFFQGCMYELTNRCGHRFVKVTS